MAKERCPHCRSPRAIRRGYRQTGYGRKPLRKCSDCGRKFTPDDGFLRMRFHPRIIGEAVKLYKKGNSSSEVRRMLRNREGVEVSRWSIIKWFRKYGAGKQAGLRAPGQLGRQLDTAKLTKHQKKATK